MRDDIGVSREEMLRRICGEYLEMPGLRLKREQAQRLWALDDVTCQELLELLVESRFLYRTSNGAYARLIEGALHPPSQIVKAAPESGASRTEASRKPSAA